MRAIVLLAVIVGGFVLAERVIVYAFDPRQITPDLPGVTEREIISATGKTMVVWIAKPQGRKPTILYLHGNAGGLNDRRARFSGLLKNGYGLIAPGYRGSSGSGGWPIEHMIRRDMEGLYRDVTSGTLTGTPTTPVIYGESIGAAVAIQLNAAISQDSPPRAIVLEAPFTSLREVARAMHPELVLATGFMTSLWDSLSAAPTIRAPLLVLHGRNDQLVPIEQGRAIYDAAQSQSKAFFEVPDAAHIDVWKVSAQKRLYRFLTQF